MKSKMTAYTLLVLACLWLAGCASAPVLGMADTTGFDARGATVRVDYVLDGGEAATAAEREELRNERMEELDRLLREQGFQPVASGPAEYRIVVTEGAREDVANEWQDAAGTTAVLFTLGLVPAVFEYRKNFHYELWAGQQRIHAFDTPATWQEALGLVSISSTLSGTRAARQKARLGAHGSVLALWIEQGSFE